VISTTLPTPQDRRVMAVGIGVWLAAFVLLPVPVAVRITLLAPLVIVPRLLGMLPPRPLIQRVAGWWSLLAAIVLTVAFALPAGPVAAVLSAPWLAVALTAAAAAVAHGVPHLPGVLHPPSASDLGVDVALGLLGAGAVFLSSDRAGFRPMDFAPVTILLTGTHFHFAGFGLLAITSLLAASRPLVRLPVLGLVLGIPLTAVGFVTRSDAISALGAIVVGSSGIAVGIALLANGVADASRWALRAAGAALLVGMPLGIAWALSILTGFVFLDLETMVRTHGALNASAVLLATLGSHGR
jgi:YndJ-like protein